MPQWTRDDDAMRARHPDERWEAWCPRADALLLLVHDHHVVRVDGRRALLLTYTWWEAPLDAADGPLRLEVSFTHPDGHPAAPAEVQVVVDGLAFKPVGG